MKKSTIAAALISTMSLSVAPLVSQAQSYPGQSSPTGSEPLSDKSFLDLDRNLDGLISIEEASSHPTLSSQFEQADRNGNSQVDVSEFSAFVATTQDQEKSASGGQADQVSSFETLDVDKDGRVSHQEADVDPSLSQQYTSVDLDSDGYISATEFSAFETKRGGEPGMQGSGGQPQDFSQLDTNKDGMLTLPEVKGKPIEQQFSSIDSNGDGSVSQQEYQTAMAPGAGGPQISFQSLDADRNGWISPSEANANPTVSSQFTAIDRDRNGFLDQSEFSAFETSQQMEERRAPQ